MICFAFAAQHTRHVSLFIKESKDEINLETNKFYYFKCKLAYKVSCTDRILLTILNLNMSKKDPKS